MRGRPPRPVELRQVSSAARSGNSRRELALMRRQHQRRRAGRPRRVEECVAAARQARSAHRRRRRSPPTSPRAAAIRSSANSPTFGMRAEPRPEHQRAGLRARRGIPATSSSDPALRRMIEVRCAALTGKALAGDSSVTAPAPARAAAIADSRAAPVAAGPPENTPTWPRAYLCVSLGRRRKDAQPKRRTVLEAVRPIAVEHIGRECRCRRQSISPQ